jgi:hypothetical protein
VADQKADGDAIPIVAGAAEDLTNCHSRSCSDPDCNSGSDCNSGPGSDSNSNSNSTANSSANSNANSNTDADPDPDARTNSDARAEGELQLQSVEPDGRSAGYVRRAVLALRRRSMHLQVDR